jgi:cytochrome P450
MRDGGDLCSIRFFNVPVVIPTTPALLHEVMVEHHRSAPKSLATRMMFHPFAGHSVFTLEADPWRRQRKLMAPLFSPGAVRSYAPQMNAVITRQLDGWKDGDVIDVGREMTSITMGVVGKVLFDADHIGDADEIGGAVRRMFEYLAEQSGSFAIVLRAILGQALLSLTGPPPWTTPRQLSIIDWLSKPIPWPTPERQAFLGSVRTLDRTIQRMIDERRRKTAGGASASERDDLLTRLLAARDEDDGSFMTDKQVRDEAVTLFIAGHETTATAMTWALYALSRMPEVYRRWKEEIAGLGGRMPEAEDAGRLVYTRGIFKEALRLYPPAFAFDRVLIEDTVVGGYLLPKGTGVIVTPYAVHRRPDLWPDPERFDPERFTPEAEASRPRGAFLPFGMGPRICIGAAFAQLEAELLLAQIAQRFELEAEDLAPIGESIVATVRPARPVRVRVRARKLAHSGHEITA